MKALVCHQFGPLDDLTVEDLPIPVPGPGKVTIHIKAASLNFPDALTVQGLYQVKPQTPFVPGAEFAGVIHAVGEGVTHVKVGDRVISTGRGGFAEYAEADARILMPIPPSMSFEQAAAFVYPSYYEGFGIPILEALFSKIPVITSQGGCFEEVGGRASLYVNPSDYNQLSEAISVLFSDSIGSAKMIQQG